jgi:CheY-like chemotaxis protein
VPAQQALSKRPSRPEPAASDRSLRILVAEDTPVNQKFITHLLEKDGHKVKLACDGAEAIAFASEEEFDVIFMDVQMPGTDGFAATAKIREQEKAAGTHTPIIALTAHALAGYRERCVAGGMDDYLSKPVKIAEVRRLLAQIGQRTAKKVPQQEHSVWNREEALTQAAGDEELLDEMLSMFLTDSVQLANEIEKAIAANDAERLEHAAHSLKGELGCIGANSVMERAREIEEAGRRANFSAAATLMSALQQDLRELRSALSQVLQARQGVGVGAV